MTQLGKAALLCALGIAATVFAGSVSAGQIDPGWYFGVEGFNAKPRNSNGNATATVTTAPSTAGGCPASSMPVGILDPLNILVNSGLTLLNLCLIAPPTTKTPGSQTTLNLGTASMSFNSAYGGGFSLGYMFDGGFRPEFNFNYIQNDVKNYSLGNASNRYSLTAYRTMANAWYDFDFGIPVTPYLGGGIGAQFSKFDAAGSGGNTTTFAYQLGGGFNIWATSKLALSLDYRYVAAGQPTFDYTGSVASSGGSIPAKVSQQTEYKAQQFGVGMKYLFGEHGRDVADSDGDGVPDRLDKCPNTPRGVQVDQHGCPLDSDGDGVPDYLDKCPNTPRGATVNAQGCMLDSDGDGVPDYLDKCPNTPRGVRVDARGCPFDSDGDGVPDYLDKCPRTPKGVLVGPDGCPLADSDHDGVPDYLDKCPNTPLGQKVGADGCPLDSDGDGVPDDQDECPNTPAGAKVLPNGCALKGDCRHPRPGEQIDQNGCAVEHSFILKGVKFEFDSDRLTPAAKEILNQVSDTLKAYPEINVEVQGHTDYIGTDAYNLGLSEKRAIAVKTYLIGRGVEATRLTPVGYGKTRPLDNNDTEAGRESNRRVELKVFD